jgi:hypothetical protein
MDGAMTDTKQGIGRRNLHLDEFGKPVVAQ